MHCASLLFGEPLELKAIKINRIIQNFREFADSAFKLPRIDISFLLFLHASVVFSLLPVFVE